MNSNKILYKDLSYKIVGLAMEVHRKLGYGFLEEVVGDYYADILVEDEIILELKAIEKIADAHRAQTLNYLKATELHLAILLNFGKERLEYKRLVQ